jgi:D-alanine--poly(phosphoribitol) ligase subunit 2
MERLLALLNEIHPGVDYEKSEALIDENILDSIDIVGLVSEIAGEFDVAIPPEEIVPENFNSAKALYALIERLIDEG